MANRSAAIVAHRGASHDAPENTLAAFRLAWQQQADAVECDVRLTADGRPAVMHDATTARTTGADLTVSETALDDLRRLDAGAWKDPRWAGERVPHLAEVLATVPDGRGVIVEVKSGLETVPVVADVLNASPIDRARVVVVSFSEQVISAVGERLPGVERRWLWGFRQDAETGSWNITADDLVARARRCGADSLGLSASDAIDDDLVRTLRTAGLPLHVWTIDDPALARRMIALGAASITTNRPGRLRAELEGA